MLAIKNLNMIQNCGSTSWRVGLGLYILLVRNVFTHSLRSDIYTILNMVAGMHLCIGSQNSLGRARSKVESNGP